MTWRQQTARFGLAIDRDSDAVSSDDPLDFQPGQDAPDSKTQADREIRRSINLIEEPTAGILANGIYDQVPTWTYTQATDKGDDGDGDIKSGLGYRLTDNVARYFVENAIPSTLLNPTLPPVGSVCTGSFDCR